MKKFSRAISAAALALAAGIVACPATGLAQPANDLCTGAEPIAVTPGGSGSVAYDNTAATDDTGLSFCGMNEFAGSGTKGVWFSFTGTGNRVSFDICGVTLDQTLRVFCGDCTTPVCAASDDDGCDGTTGVAPRLALCTSPGVTYRVLLARYGGTAGAGIASTLNWSDNGAACPAAAFPSCTSTPPGNDDCTGAVPVAIGATVVGTTIDATADAGVPTCGGVVSDNAVWYSFVSDGGSVTVTTCSAITGTNTKVAVFSGGCGGQSCVAGAGTTAPVCADRNDVATAVAPCTVAGQTYYIAVSGEFNGKGLFSLTLTSIPCVPPPNDDCASAEVITSTPFTTTANSGTAAADTDVGCNAAANTTTRAGVWYRYTPTEPGTLSFTETGAADVVFAVFSTPSDCSALSEVFCNTGETGAVPFAVTAGTTYYILVGLFSDTTTPPAAGYVLTIGFAASPGACCVGTACTVVSGLAACTGTGGVFQGYGVGCGGGPLPENVNGGTVSVPDYAGPPPAPSIPVTSVVNVTDTSVITDLDVYVDIAHTFGSDLYLRLTGPNGVTVDLFRRAGVAAPCTVGVIGNGSALTGTYIFDNDASTTLHAAVIAAPGAVTPGRFLPSTCVGAVTSLEAAGPAGFGGIPASGAWTLTASDEDEGVVGSIVSFGLVVNGVEANTPCTGTGTGACCTGVGCSVLDAAACVGAGTRFAGAGTACNAPGNLTTPCCRADVSQSGGVTVQDLFDYLTIWFPRVPAAEFDGLPGVTIQDLFDFLGAWFGNCL